MRRTVEHIVARHQAAATLRKAGSPVWEKKIIVKAIRQQQADPHE